MVYGDRSMIIVQLSVIIYCYNTRLRYRRERRVRFKMFIIVAIIYVGKRARRVRFVVQKNNGQNRISSFIDEAENRFAARETSTFVKLARRRLHNGYRYKTDEDEEDGSAVLFGFYLTREIVILRRYNNAIWFRFQRGKKGQIFFLPPPSFLKNSII